ncbi:HAD family hydrolase [Dawidia soli]|uniref:HAD family phosphatase n=1 Tax=Dawidia soli TaxID=2782352 RepID=A0AAP2GHI9_9BACT|nr:HAD family phosphatase [Dawidia soli]MBT1687261.1 HAD family phosphatase [Dawidia soli]
MAQESSVKNLIFDLGGVILDLSVEHTLQAFANISGLDKSEVTKRFVTSEGFVAYEKGLIDDVGFRAFVRDTYPVQADDAALDAAWNAMLRGLPLNKLQLLLRLKEQYQSVLLSNTNNIHLEYINTRLLPPGERSLDPYFHRTYYSHRMHKRKPDAEIFEQVLHENNFQPHETLFLDDNAENIAGARKLGIQTVHVITPDLIIDYFHA